MSEQRSSHVDGKTYLKMAWGVTAVAFLLRLINLGKHSYWFDEAREVVRILTPWPEILFVSEGADPPLFRLIHYPIAQVTTNEFWLRFPAVLFGALACYLVFFWLRELGNPKLGIVTAVLLAFAPVEIFYAQEVSQYSLSVFLAVWLLVTFEAAGRNGRLRDWVLLAVVSLISIYSYYGLAWLLPALDIDLAWRIWKTRSRPKIIGFVSYHVAILLGVFGLYFLYLAEQFNRVTQNQKVARLFIDLGLLRTLRLVDNKLFNGFVRFFIMPFSPDGPDVIIWFFIVLFFLGIYALWRMHLKRVFLLLAAIVTTLFVAYGFGLYPFDTRYVLMITPLFFASIAAGLLFLWRWRPISVGLSVLIGVVFILFWPNLHILPNPWRALPREELHPVMDYLHEQVQADDAIYVYYGAIPAYTVYQKVDNETIYGSWFREWPLNEKVDEIQTAVGAAPRFWIIFAHITPTEFDDLRETFSQDTHRLVGEYEAPNAAALLFERR
ncbi:MAG: hypothetical protein GY943_03750 [Chloroflexi bacterium]|nr:hypothetical protein [Chloroflexota bacterium]